MSVPFNLMNVKMSKKVVCVVDPYLLTNMFKSQSTTCPVVPHYTDPFHRMGTTIAWPHGIGAVSHCRNMNIEIILKGESNRDLSDDDLMEMGFIFGKEKMRDYYHNVTQMSIGTHLLI